MPRRITLTQFIEITGIKPIARALQVENQVVYQWKNLSRLPKAENMRQLVKMSKGRLTYERIIEPFFAAREASN